MNIKILHLIGIAIIIGTALSSCGRNNKANTKIFKTDHQGPMAIKVDFSNDKTPKVKIEKVVQLETNEDVLIGDVGHLRVAKDHYVIGDGKNITTFTKEGKVVNVLNPVGKGPREVSDLYYFVLEDEVIYIHDYNTKKMLSFDIFGNFVDSKEISLNNGDFEYFNNRCLSSRESQKDPDEKALEIFSEDGELTNTGIDIIEFPGIRLSGCSFKKYNDYILYHPTMHNTIYKIDKQDSISVAYEIDFGNSWVTPEEAKNLDTQSLFEILIGDKDKLSHFEFTDGGRFIYISFAMKQGVFHLYYDKTDGGQYLIHSNATDKSSLLQHRVSCCVDGRFHTVITPDNLPVEVKEMGIEADDEDNPLIVIWSIE